MKLQLQVSKRPGVCTNSLECNPQPLRIFVELAQFSPKLGILLHASLTPSWLCQCVPLAENVVTFIDLIHVSTNVSHLYIPKPLFQFIIKFYLATILWGKVGD